ncbi:MAG: Hsp20/alpha crystallin family protein [Acidobacteria bacterium]|nr:Hsp20/alpha crystallin family protein [Acidobacteriota bacterium]
MSLTRWDPYRDLVALQERMNRLFDTGLKTRTSEEEITSGSWTPPVDIYETDHSLVIKAELPEMNRKDIDIRVENNVLSFRGQRKLRQEVKEENYHRIERAYGSFSRSFSLPTSVDPESAEANYVDGVLTIELKKKEEAKPKQIEIR